MNDPARPFIDSVEVTKPYLLARSVSGIIILIGHLVFIYLFSLMVLRRGPERKVPPWREALEVAGR